MPWTILFFIIFGGMAVGCALSMVAQRNPLYSAVSLIGVFVALACLYLTLAAPFIAAVQIIVYAGAIMVLVVFVIMLLNAEEEARRPYRLKFLIPAAVGMATVLIAEAAFMLTVGGASRPDPQPPKVAEVGLTASVGTGLFTEYLLPFEVTSVLILMALVGAITLARRTQVPGMADEDLAVAGGSAAAEGAAGGDGSIIKPGDTEATGQAMAREQIARGEAAAPARRDEDEKEGE
jgi:NADH-quinone oxidoreductase subunit J